MSYHWYTVLGKPSQAPAAGKYIAQIDLVSRSLKVNTLLEIVPVAANYTVPITDTGKVLIVTAAATISLPDPVASLKGMHFTAIVGADVSVTFNTVTANTDKLVVFNDVAADSFAFSTASEKAGNAVHWICDGALWYAMVMLGAETATPVITT